MERERYIDRYCNYLSSRGFRRWTGQWQSCYVVDADRTAPFGEVLLCLFICCSGSSWSWVLFAPSPLEGRRFLIVLVVSMTAAASVDMSTTGEVNNFDNNNTNNNEEEPNSAELHQFTKRVFDAIGGKTTSWNRFSSALESDKNTQ